MRDRGYVTAAVALAPDAQQQLTVAPPLTPPASLPVTAPSAATSAPELSAEVVLVTRNSLAELSRSLPAIRDAAEAAGAPLLFVDLGSTDGTRSYAESHAPGARGVWLTEQDQRVDALMAAAACSSADVLVVLDPTLEPGAPDALTRLVDHLGDHPYAGIAAPALLTGTGEPLRSTRPAPIRREHSRVEWVLDAAFAIRRDELAAITRHAGRRRRSLEDHGLCMLLRRRGLEVHYLPTVELLDRGGQAAAVTGARVQWGPLPVARLLVRHPRYALRLAGRRRAARKLARAATRVLELAVTIPLLALAAPLMVAIALAIRLDSPGSVLFRQVRLGRGARPFRMYKFRTMRTDADPALHAHFVRDMILGRIRSDGDDAAPRIFKIHPDPRVTRVGRFLRRTSLDELPQLFNVLRGEMTLVGFRPPIPYEVDDYPAWYHRRFDGKPGITGLWQVSGRNERSYEEMVRLDIEYLNRRSWLFDVLLLARTVVAVIGGRGAY